MSIATSRQVIPRNQLALTVCEFFALCFAKKVYDLDPRIDAILKVVHLNADHQRLIGSFSGGQQARLLLASALIQDPDLLLLDEPTNNFDTAGIEHLTDFLKNYRKTVIVISHDAEFLNAFTNGVLYLDVFTKKIERYVGNYFDAMAEVAIRIERENSKNAQLAKQIQAKKDQANVFAHKGGQLRLVAKRMREKAEELEEEKVDIRKEDKTIRSFVIPHQAEVVGEILRLKRGNISLKKNQHLLLKGPNGIGKSTLLEAIASGKSTAAVIAPGVKVGYYRQDFSTLDFDQTVFKALLIAAQNRGEHHVRSVAAGFLITGDIINTKIGNLSEGQKGLVAFACLVLERPGLLLLDEPTNHINFRHVPVVAKALDEYEGAMILVSHVPEFVSQIRIDETLDLAKNK